MRKDLMKLKQEENFFKRFFPSQIGIFTLNASSPNDDFFFVFPFISLPFPCSKIIFSPPKACRKIWNKKETRTLHGVDTESLSTSWAGDTLGSISKVPFTRLQLIYHIHLADTLHTLGGAYGK